MRNNGGDNDCGVKKYDNGHQGVQKHGPRSKLSLPLPSLVVLDQPVL